MLTPLVIISHSDKKKKKHTKKPRSVTLDKQYFSQESFFLLLKSVFILAVLFYKSYFDHSIETLF